MEEHYERNLKGYKLEAERFQQQAETAKQDLQDYKKSTEVAFDEFCDAKDRIDELEFELAKIKGGEDFDEDRQPRRKYRQQLTRRESKRSLTDGDDSGDAEGAGLTSYLSSWYYGAPSGSAKDSSGEEKAEETSKTIDLSSRSHRTSIPSDEDGQTPSVLGAWGLTAYFQKEDKPDHEMNLTD